jgi:hypothetical protein
MLNRVGVRIRDVTARVYVYVLRLIYLLVPDDSSSSDGSSISAMGRLFAIYLVV